MTADLDGRESSSVEVIFHGNTNENESSLEKLLNYVSLRVVIICDSTNVLNSLLGILLC